MNYEERNRQQHSDPLPWVILLVMLLLIFGGVGMLLVRGQNAAPAETAAQPATTPAPRVVTTSPAAPPAKPATPAPPVVVSSPVAPPPGTGTTVPKPPPDSGPAATPTIFAHPPVDHGTIVSPPLPGEVPATPRADASLPSPAAPSLALAVRVSNPDFGNVTVEPSSPNNQYPRGASVTLVAAPKPGFRFSGWGGDASGSATSITVVMDRHKTIWGDFARMSYALNIDAPPRGGTISIFPNLKSFEAGSKVTLEARPAAGYIFESWSGDVSGSQNPVTLVMDNDKKIGGSFVQGQYALNAKVNPMGFIDINPPGNRQDSNGMVTLTARPSPNFRFVSWSGDVSSAAPTITITMNSNKNVTANFVKVVTLTTVVNPTGYGTASPVSADYDQGTEVTITAVPYSGFEFKGWTGQITSPNATERIVMDTDKSVMANFDIIPRK